MDNSNIFTAYNNYVSNNSGRFRKNVTKILKYPFPHLLCHSCQNLLGSGGGAAEITYVVFSYKASKH